MQRGKLRERLALSIREVVFGLEDSLVSTLGTVTGVAVGTGDRFVVVLSGIIIVAVEVVSMAAGSYLSSKSATQFTEAQGRSGRTRLLSSRNVRGASEVRVTPLFSALVMGVFYTLGGLIVLLPYFLFPVQAAIPTACFMAIMTLFIVGYIKGKLTGTSVLRSACEMAGVSCVAVLLGFGLGRLVPTLFGLESVY